MLKSMLPALALFWSVACAASTHSSPNEAAPDLTPVGEADIADGPDFEVRQSDPDLFLAAAGDFDGDGKNDEARFYKDDALGAFAVIVSWGDAAKERVTVHADTLANVAQANVRALPPGPLRFICYGPVEGCDDQDRKTIETSTEGVAIIYLGMKEYFAGKQVVYVWNGEAFNAYTIVD